MAGEHRPPAHTLTHSPYPFPLPIPLTHSPYQGSPLLQKNRSRSKKPIPSQARKRESRGERRVWGRWIPASAGMTATERSENRNAIALPLKGGEGEKGGPVLAGAGMTTVDRLAILYLALPVALFFFSWFKL